MSRPRSRSPHFRRSPWEEPDFDPHKVLAEPDRSPQDRSLRLRKDPEERWDYFREDLYPEGRRRSPPFPDERQFRRQRLPDEEAFYRRRPSPHSDANERNARGDVDRRRGGGGGGGGGGFREHRRGFDNRGRSSRSPLRLARERLPPTPRSHADPQQREPGRGWREEQGSGFSPADEQRGGGGGGGAAGRERGRRDAQDPGGDGREDRTPPFKRQRREKEDAERPGFRRDEDFVERRYPGDAHAFGGDGQGSPARLRPLVIEHCHGMAERGESPRWGPLGARGGVDPDFDRRRSPRPPGSSQERFGTSEGRTDARDGARGRRFQDAWRDSAYLETRRSPAPQERPNPMRHGGREGPGNQKGRGGSRPMRGRFARGQGGRTGPPRSQPRPQQAPHGYRDLPREERGPGYRPLGEDGYEGPAGGGAPRWTPEDGQWERDGPRSPDRRQPRENPDPKMPRQRERGWSDQKAANVAVVKEETLTIKVDMSRPLPKNSSSPLCYSSDRQLSLDLVNVGRQRLDFLPMLEHSGTYQETAVHTGTFAQEIITLVHHVKEHYFRGDGLTLNERFSAPQKGGGGGGADEETPELTLDERFSANRGFNLNINSLLDDDEPLMSRLGPMQALSQQPVRGPGDLRHDLERRRQERLEGVKVTIPGSGVSQRRPGGVSEPGLEYGDGASQEEEEEEQEEEDGFSSWSGEQSGRREANMAARRGAPYRHHAGSMRRNTRGFGNRVGPMRRQNHRSNPAGPNW